MRKARDGIPALLAQEAGKNVGQRWDKDLVAQAYASWKPQWTRLQGLHIT